MFALTVVFAAVVLIVYFNSYIVTYNLDGGIMEETETRVWVGSEYSLPTPTKDGAAFAGWYLDGEYFSPEGIWNIESDVVLTAQWGLSDELGVVYVQVDGGYVIDSYVGAVENVIVLPKEYNEMPVVGIKENAFDMLKNRLDEVEENFIKVYVPDTAITGEGTSVFEGVFLCPYNTVGKDDFIYLEGNSSTVVVGYLGTYHSIVVPETYNGKTVVGVGNYAFYGTSAYVNTEAEEFCRILLPETVVSVGKSAFELCSGARASLYYINDNGPLEMIDRSRLQAWLDKVVVADGNEQLVDVLTFVRPAFGWDAYTRVD